MHTLFKILVTPLIWALSFGGYTVAPKQDFGATSVFQVFQGGTGNSTLSSGQVLYGSGTGVVQSVSTSSLGVGASLSSSGTLGSQIGGTASSISLNLGNANTWTGMQTFANTLTTNASTTFATTTSQQSIPTSASPSIGNNDLAIDTTANQLLYGSNGLVNAITATSTGSFNIASTTLDDMGGSFAISTTTLIMKNSPEPFTLQGFYCIATSTGSVSLRFGDGTNWTPFGTCTTSGNITWVSTNNTFTAFENFVVQIGKINATIPSRVTVSAIVNKTRQ